MSAAYTLFLSTGTPLSLIFVIAVMLCADISSLFNAF